MTCGLQRVALNIAPALSRDGRTVYVVTRSHFISRYGYLVAIDNGSLTLRWATSLRGDDRIPGDYFSGGSHRRL